MQYDLITALAFILILGLLVFVHELGHFLTARLFKVRVEEFGFGFPPRVFPGRARAEQLRAQGKTVYSLNLLPLGGFVRLAGENGVSTPEPEAHVSEAATPDREWHTPGDYESPTARTDERGWRTLGGRREFAGYERGRRSLSGGVASADDPGSFAGKPAWQRAIILAAGAFNNMALAMLLVFFMFVGIGTPRVGIEVTGVALHSPAAAAGLRAGDIIRAVDGHVPQTQDDVVALEASHIGRPVTLQVLRDGETYTTSLVPRARPACDQGPMGVITVPIHARYVPTDPGRAVSAALSVPGSVVQGIVGLINPPTTATCPYNSTYVGFGGAAMSAMGIGTQRVPGAMTADPCLAASGSGGGIAGPIGIIRQVGCEVNSVPTQGWLPLLTLVVELSATLAVMNLLPIPALDGGRLLFVLISVVSRKRIRPEVEGMAHAVGMAALLTIMLVVSWHDVVNLLNNRPAF